MHSCFFLFILTCTYITQKTQPVRWWCKCQGITIKLLQDVANAFQIKNDNPKTTFPFTTTHCKLMSSAFINAFNGEERLLVSIIT